MQVLTGHAKTTPLALMLKDNVPVNAPLYFIKAQKLVEVAKMSKVMTEIHAQVAEKATRDRKAANQDHNDKTHVCTPNCQVGDYVLIAEHRAGWYVQVSGKVEGPAPCRECGVRLRVCCGEYYHEVAQGRARNSPAILSGYGTQRHSKAGRGRRS
jgi:hypothetical protein